MRRQSALGRQTDDPRTNYDKISWKLIRGMRNIFVHEYENVDLARTWATIETDVPLLKAYCEEILSQLRE